MLLRSRSETQNELDSSHNNRGSEGGRERESEREGRSVQMDKAPFSISIKQPERLPPLDFSIFLSPLYSTLLFFE